MTGDENNYKMFNKGSIENNNNKDGISQDSEQISKAGSKNILDKKGTPRQTRLI